MISLTEKLIDAVGWSVLSSQQDNKNEWVKLRNLAIKYFYGRTEEETKEYYIDFDKKKVPIENNNVTKRVIERTSLVYMQPPIRLVGKEGDGNDSQRTRYNELTRGKDERMHKSEKFLNLLNLIAVHPAVRNKQIEHDIITDFEPRFADDDPMTPIGISYPLHRSSEVLKNDKIKWVYWDDKEKIIYDGATQKIISKEQHNLGLLPFRFVFTDKPETYFMDVEPAIDLIEMNEVVNVLGTDATLNMRYNSHGQYYGTGFREETEIRLEIGADHMWTLPDGASAGVLTPPNMIQSMSQGIKDKIRVVTNNFHLPQGFIEGDQAQPESGTALRIRNQELTDERVGDVKRWRMVEEDLYKIERRIAEVNFKQKLPEEFSVDYKEQDQILTSEEQTARDDWALLHNQTTEAKILLRDNPDKYENLEAAEKEVTKNRDFNKAKAESEKTPTDRIFEGLNTEKPEVE